VGKLLTLNLISLAPKIRAVSSAADSSDLNCVTPLEKWVCKKLHAKA